MSHNGNNLLTIELLFLKLAHKCLDDLPNVVVCVWGWGGGAEVRYSTLFGINILF